MKGSKYALLKWVESGSFIKELNTLLECTKATISEYDNWMPKSLLNEREAELKDFLKYNFSQAIGENMHDWWLAVKHPMSRTPNWDLVSTCTIKGKKGLLLVEAKAHDDELHTEGKPLNPKASADSQKNHDKIEVAIKEANDEINKIIAPGSILISRNNCYQLSNRVAHAWWLANQGIPVVLVYLGFLNCQDMNDGQRKLFMNDVDWQKCFVDHAKQVGVDKLLNKSVSCKKSEFVLLCKSH